MTRMKHTFVSSKDRTVSATRDRNQALQFLVPKILGLFWDQGQMEGVGAKVWLDHEIWLSAVQFNEILFALSVYAPTSRALEVKVLSLVASKN